MFKSKRFIAFTVAVILFILLLYTTDYSPMEIAGGITTITGVYIGAQTYRKSGSE
ncbi:MAG TPA: hypothetical protein PLG47_05905 [Candidatus Dojkabacteria bacterium]|nr:hypothetical protein [Candidatus Dojkabacteria bacterium]